jgi:hypothetical protein
VPRSWSIGIYTFCLSLQAQRAGSSPSPGHIGPGINAPNVVLRPERPTVPMSVDLQHPNGRPYRPQVEWSGPVTRPEGAGLNELLALLGRRTRRMNASKSHTMTSRSRFSSWKVEVVSAAKKQNARGKSGATDSRLGQPVSSPRSRVAAIEGKLDRHAAIRERNQTIIHDLRRQQRRDPVESEIHTTTPELSFSSGKSRLCQQGNQDHAPNTDALNTSSRLVSEKA